MSQCLKAAKQKTYLLTKRPMTFGKHSSPKTVFYWETKKTIFGKWATKDLVDLAQRYT